MRWCRIQFRGRVGVGGHNLRTLIESGGQRTAKGLRFREDKPRAYGTPFSYQAPYEGHITADAGGFLPSPPSGDNILVVVRWWRAKNAIAKRRRSCLAESTI